VGEGSSNWSRRTEPFGSLGKSWFCTQTENLFLSQNKYLYTRLFFEQNPFEQNPFKQNPFEQNLFEQNAIELNAFEQNSFEQNPFEQKHPRPQQSHRRLLNVRRPDLRQLGSI
jgi:hypothetical protein